MKKIITTIIYSVIALGNASAFQSSPDIKIPSNGSTTGLEGVNVGDLDWSQIMNGAEAPVPPPSIKKPGVWRNVAKIYGGKKIWNNKGKIIVLGGASLIGIGITKAKYLELINNPEEHEEFMTELIEDKPKRFEVFHKFVLFNYFRTDDEEYKHKLEEFIDYYNLALTQDEKNKLEMAQPGIEL